MEKAGAEAPVGADTGEGETEVFADFILMGRLYGKNSISLLFPKDDCFQGDLFVENQDSTRTHCVGKESVRMQKLFGYAEKYIAKSDWKDLAMLKFCLFAMGILAGMRIPEKNRKQAGWIAAAVFAATYIPLMAKFFSVIREKED